MLLDQRGAGKSTPCAEVRDNTTQRLIEDIETLRGRLGVPKWHMVFGGSWGSTLSLAYAQAHPERVGSLVLRGVFLGSRAELDWGDQGARTFFPELQERFVDFLPAADRATPEASYYKLLTSGDRASQLAAGRSWNSRELLMSTLETGPDALAVLDDENWTMSHARLEAHYFVNNCFLEDRQLVRPENAAKIQHIPTSIVQGRLDFVCPPSAAWDLHKALPQSKIYFIANAGHSAMEPGTFKKLRAVCDEYARLDTGASKQ